MARRWQRSLGVWLGILAVAVNALLPIHLAKDIIHAAGHLRMAALAAAAPAPAADPHHHHDHPGGNGHHQHDGGCLVCSGLSAAVAATTLPPMLTLAAPGSLALPAPPIALRALAGAAARTPYAPRAPPGAI